MKRIIIKTGAPGKLFKSIKFHLFGIRDTEVEQIEIQHNLRKQIKKNMNSKTNASEDLSPASPIKMGENGKSKNSKDVNEYIYNKTLENKIDRKEMFSDII